MAQPKFIDEVAFASNPLDTTQTYTVLTSRTARRSFGRGRRSENDTPDTGTCQVTFENSDRYLDPEYAAGPYYPNVIPMRRIRCWVDDVIAADGGSLTVSGNEVTDATRAAALLLGTGASGQMIDGRTADSSFGIRRAATNLFRRGQCDATTDWLNTSGVTLNTTDATVPAPFSTQSIKMVCDGTGSGQGAVVQTASGQAIAAGQSCVGSVYFKGVAGQSYQCFLSLVNTDATQTNGATLTFTATGAWQLVTPAAVVVAVGKTGDTLRIRLVTNGARAETLRFAHAMLEQNQSVVAPYVATSGGATATHNAGTPTFPASLLNTTQGWCVERVRVGWSSAVPPNNYPTAFRWQLDANNRLIGYYDAATGKFFFVRRAAAAGNSASITAAITAGDFVTLIFAWDANFVYLSVNGSAFVKTANTAIPAVVAAPQILHGDNFFDSDILWFACGTGTLTDADAATINAMGNTAADASDMLWPAAANVSMVWQADTATYRVPTDSFLYTNFIDPERGWQLDRVGPGQMNAVVPANDGFDLLSTFKFDATVSYAQQKAGVRINAMLDTIGWPAGERDIDTTSQQSDVQAMAAGDLDGVSALDAIRDVASGENGVFFIDGRGYAVFKGRHRTDTRHLVSRATFVDAQNYIAGRYLYAELTPSQSKIRNDFRVTRRGGTEKRADDPTSITKNGRRVESVSTLHTTDAEALNYAQYRLLLEKDPHRRYDEMKLVPGDDTTMWILLLSLEIGDRITVMQTPPGGGAADTREMYVEAINASIGPTTESEWTLRLSPVSSLTGWMLGDAVYSLLGQSTALTY